MTASTPTVNDSALQGSLARACAALWQRKAALILALPLLVACAQRPAVVIHTAQGAVVVKVEIVDTPDTRARGLMYRKDLAPDAGMLFLFPNETVQNFWMKNTPLPLDMIFISANHRIVGIVANTRPFSTEPRGVEGSSKYVLEVNAGFGAKHAVAAGEQVEFVGPGFEPASSAQ